MAAGADGTITIDTTLDDTGFLRGTQKMQRAIDAITQGINRFGNGVWGSVRSAFSNLQSIGQRAEAIAQSMSGAVGAGGFARSLTGVQRQVVSLQGQLQRLGDAAALGFKTDAQMQRFSLQVGHAQDRLQQLQQAMEQIGGQRFNTAEYERLTAEMEKAEAILDRLTQRKDMEHALGVDEESRAYQRLLIQITQAEAEYGRLRDARDALTANGQGYTLGADSQEYQQTAAMLEGMAANLQHFQEIASGFGVATQPAGESTQALGALDHELQQKPQDAGAASSALSRFGSVMGTVGSTALSTTGMLLKLPFKALGSGFKAITSHLSSFGRQSAKTGNLAQSLVKSLTSLKRMLITRIKRTFISAIFRGLQAGMQSFARYSSAFNAAMSSMKNSMTGLSGNIAVFAGSLINAVAPAISTVIDWISQAISYINALFALLSGKGTFTVAKKGTDDYAKSLKGAGGAAKDLKNQVYGFDELNKENDTSSGGGGSSGGSVDFEEESFSILPESVLNFFDRIKEAIFSAQWEEVGEVVADGLNSIISAVDGWITGISGKATQWSSNIARVFNGLVSGFNWSGLGGTISNGLNTAFSVLNTFLTTFNFSAFGAGIGSAINGAVSRADWSLITSTFGNKWNALVNTISGFLSSVDWAAMGSSIASGVNAWFNTISWTGIVAAFNQGIKSAFDLIFNFVDTLDWRGIGEVIGSAINDVDVVSWLSDFGKTLSSFLVGVYDLFSGFIESIDWIGLGQQLWDGIIGFIENFDWVGVVSSAYEYLGAAIGAAVGLVAGLASKMWETIKAGWEATKTYFGEYVDAYGGDVIAGLWAGITNALKDVATWVHTNVIKPLVSGMEKALGLEEGTISKIASDIWEGLKNGLSTAWTNISSKVSEIFTNAWNDMISVFNKVGEVASNIWEGLKNGLSSAWKKFKDDLLSPFTSFWDEVKKFFGIASPSTAAESVGGFILEGLKNGLTAAYDAVIGPIKSVFESIWSGIKSIFGFGKGESEESKSAKEAGKDIMTGMQEGITGDENTVKDAVKNAAKNALQALRTELGIPGESGASTKTKTYGENLDTGLKDGIEAKGVQATFTAAANKVWSAVKDALNGAFGTSGENSSASKSKYVGQGVALGVNDGINDKGKKGTFTAAADATIKAVKDAINTAFGISSEGSAATKGKYAGNSVVLGLRDGITEKAVAATFTTAANTVQSAVSSALATALGVSGGGLFGGNVSASKFKDVGKAICQGVADGINANTSTIKSAAESAAAAALAAAKRKLGINSPSKAFAEIGGYMMEGMGNGLKDGQSDVSRTMANIAESLVNGFSDAPALDVSADSMVNGLDNVADRLGVIASTFQAIAAAISSMGGLRVPAVASGSFTPYRARIEDSDAVRASYGALTDELKRYRTDAGEEMSDIRGLIRELIEIARSKGLTIDGRSLERSMTGLNRDRIQSYGGA
ncbi:MAG: hypothetical protein IJ662_02680 [Clostridia bacterium]|nr:hypothetical protein [Clostridia bacterium]